MHYSDILSIDARIVGFSDGIVEMECLIDPDEGRTEKREFVLLEIRATVVRPKFDRAMSIPLFVFYNNG